jgi:hypothetical protein
VTLKTVSRIFIYGLTWSLGGHALSAEPDCRYAVRPDLKERMLDTQCFCLYV